MEKELNVLEEHNSVTYDELYSISEKLTKPIDVNIVDLSSMRVLSSKRKNYETSDPQEFYDYLNKRKQQTIIIQKINDNFDNDSIFTCGDGNMKKPY